MNGRKHKSCLYYLCYISSLLKAYSLVLVCLMISIDVKHDYDESWDFTVVVEGSIFRTSFMEFKWLDNSDMIVFLCRM